MMKKKSQNQEKKLLFENVVRKILCLFSHYDFVDRCYFEKHSIPPKLIIYQKISGNFETSL